MNLTSSEIADYLSCQMVGEDQRVSGVNSLDRADEDELAFREEEHGASVADSDAGVIICPKKTPDNVDCTLIKSDNPRIDYIRVMNHFFEEKSGETFIHPTAVIDDEATIGEGSYIGPNAVITGAVELGEKCNVGPGAIIGVPGYHNIRDENGKLLEMKHHGDVVVGNQVTVHAGAFIQRAVFDETVINDRTVIGNHSGIGHNVEIGKDTWIASFVPVGGSVSIGKKVSIHLSACIGRHCNIGDNVVVASNATVLEDVESGKTVVGTPARVIE